MQDEAELGPKGAKFKAQHYIIGALALMVILNSFMYVFPSYQNSIMGNETLPSQFKLIFISSPLALLVLITIAVLWMMKGTYNQLPGK